MALFEQSPSRSGSRFGKLSSNMFFTRNTAKPKRVRHIEGLNGALICSVNDDPSVVRSSSASAIGFQRTNLPPFETPRRVERLLPPMGFWNTYGVIQDTERWRQELSSLASASGLGVEKENVRTVQRPATNAERSGARYSARTGRFNEGTPKSRGRTGSKHGTPFSDSLFQMPENEREMWMLQVLCQLLGTGNLEDVQSWLVSATPSEKEQARMMINSALQGLKESERTNNTTDGSVDLNSLTTFVERQKNEERQASNKFIQESLNRPLTQDREEKNELSLRHSWGNLSNNNYPDLPGQNTTTYKGSFQSSNRRSFSSFDTSTNADKYELNQIAEEQETPERPRSSSFSKPKRLSAKPTSQQGKTQSESIQFNDNEDETHSDIGQMNNIVEEETQPVKEPMFPPIKVKEPNEIDENAKSRKIRQLQTRLSRQEEEAKRQMSELQTKQSRLENALKLLTKQTAKSRQSAQDDHSSIGESKKSGSEMDQRRSTDNRLSKSNSGVWKPEPSVLHRLQGN